jgi:methionyl-tRNA formyltransferase
MKVVFLGNHTVGVTVLNQLVQLTDVVGVVAHPSDPEDGVRYQSVYEYSQNKSLSVVRGKAKNSQIADFILEREPDLIWVTDYRYLLPKPVIQIPKLGAVNLHPSLLPFYRGRASLNWAILHGEHQVGLTAHFIDEGMDTGDIIEQQAIDVSEREDIGDVLQRLFPIYASLTSKTIGYFKSGFVPRQPQSHELASCYPRRKPEDGRLDWSVSSKSVLNLIRAVTLPYPGAFSDIDSGRLYIWKAELANMHTGKVFKPGKIIDFKSDNTFYVQCGVGMIRVLKWSFEPTGVFQPCIGMSL